MSGGPASTYCLDVYSLGTVHPALPAPKLPRPSLHGRKQAAVAAAQQQQQQQQQKEKKAQPPRNCGIHQQAVEDSALQHNGQRSKSVER